MIEIIDFIDYIRRWLSTKWRNLVINIMIAGIITFFTCLAVKKDVFETYAATKTCLFSVLMCNTWSGLFNTIALFFSEKSYLLDDLNKFLNVRTYVLANCLIQLVLCIVESSVSTLIFSLFFQYEKKGIIFTNRSMDFLLCFFMITICADMLGFCVGLLIDKITSIMTAIPVILISHLLLSGCLFDLSGVMAKAAVFIPAHWGFYALGSVADLNSFLPYGATSHVFRNDGSYVAYCLSFLLLMTVIFILLSGIILYKKVNQTES